MSAADREAIKRRFNEEYGKREVVVIPEDPAFQIDVRERQELVGPYCRVSTMSGEQVESYELQKKQYTEMIAAKPNWTMVDIYADEGISATSIKHRADFLRLIDDCRHHKVTLIVTKSVTRFARNTVDCISTCRELKALNPPVGVLFETENIYTLGQSSEMMLNLFAAMAQSESETKSLSIKWGIRRRFANGIPRIVDLFGYERDGRTLTINRQEAIIVQLIYRWFLDGYTTHAICKKLRHHKILSPNGYESWSPTTVLYILTNERYYGDVVMQKTFVSDIFTHKSERNTGQLKQYRLPDYCPAIIDKNDWLKIQIRLLRDNWEDFLNTTTPITVGNKTMFPMILTPTKSKPD